ncbi:hypothetical protein ciss_12340 [Carboxydothermus islandicus]|uniref:ABC transporter domain-containing protein n=1 Tax=Carboxydothermus islandicus TaxID=661089 RepID=A0A1L8D2I9_9THEO|nr:ABC transporter ATP-binding protein [Carboxydothermus islandicus]GAV25301.1 hypothetical protein ciss_12340 [Carboxydothermus islandicus]
MADIENKKVFTNTKKSQQLRQFVWALQVIVTVEILIVGLAIYMMMTKGWLFYLVLALMLALYLYVSSLNRLMLGSAHVLTPEELIICLGPRFKCRLPLSLVVEAKAVSLASAPQGDLLNVSVFREDERLYCLSRNSDVIQLTLSEPIMVKAPSVGPDKSRRGFIREILINADEPERFLETITKIALPEKELDQVKSSQDTLKSLQDKTRQIISLTPPNLKLNKTPILEVKHLTKYYGDYPAVLDLNLEVYPGEIFGFLGANGAGKSTTIKMMTGLLRPSKGTILVRGEDLWQPGASVRRQIGYIPDTPLVYERLTARELLIMAGRLYNLPEEWTRKRMEELLAILDLNAKSDYMVNTYSLGMQRKVSVALALLSDPEIIIVDELTNAFDAPTLAKIKDILLNLKSQGKTVFLSTHVMDVAEKLCDRVGIIHRGQLRALGTVEELCESFGVSGGLEPLFLKLIGEETNG